MTTENRQSRREESSAESRARLVAAALEEFAVRGYRQTTLVQIADRAEISRGSIPWHFGNKDGLAFAAIQSAFQQELSAGPDGEDTDAFVAGAEAFCRAPATKMLIFLLVEALGEDSPLREHYVQLHRQMRANLRDRLERLPIADDLDPRDVTALVHAVLIGTHLQWRLAPDDIRLTRVLETLMRVLAGPADA